MSVDLSPRRWNVRRIIVISIAALALAIASWSVGTAIGRQRAVPNTPPSPIDQVNFKIPHRILTIPLVNQLGRTTNLAAFAGRTLVIADFMTSCQEQCPITTGALLEAQSDLGSAKLGSKVVIVEVSVDPPRDAPSRLLAYTKEMGVPLTLLTGSTENIARLWKWFGVYYKRVKEDTPPDIDWQTGKPYTYDVVHTDDVFVVDGTGHERALVQSNADVDGKLPKALKSLLDADGRQDLTHPGFGSWTPKQLVATVEEVSGQRQQ